MTAAWGPGWRDRAWARLGEPWDLVVVGGGITGAGLLREAARRGLRALLLEQRDFAWGTSSRSSKLVHGGLRYLRQGHFLLTRAAARERVRLIADAPGLVEPLGFLVGAPAASAKRRALLRLGLATYDVLAGRRTHRHLSPEQFALRAPRLSQQGLRGGFRYEDAQTDDARLVLRVLRDAVADGALALNAVRVDGLLRAGGRVAGVAVHDRVGGRTAEVQAAAVVNATGAWADRLRAQVGEPPRLRPLRGSHVTFAAWRLPAAEALMLEHPADRRPVFVIPWEGVTLVGTTDLDHRDPLDQEPVASGDEIEYLLRALRASFPSLALEAKDALASFCGVRPVVGTGQAAPSREPRDHVVWEEAGLLTVTGGKLTTFRLIARDALGTLARRPDLRMRTPSPAAPAAAAPEADGEVDPDLLRRLQGRYGPDAADVRAAAAPGELEAIPGTLTPWAELRWAARAEGVVHLDDLLLRRVRLGLQLAGGGAALLPRVRAICQPELGWDDARWNEEEAAYRALWASHYSVRS
jgi:glycerol-3-phosphate dehydrogenase